MGDTATIIIVGNDFGEEQGWVWWDKSDPETTKSVWVVERDQKLRLFELLNSAIPQLWLSFDNMTEIGGLAPPRDIPESVRRALAGPLVNSELTDDFVKSLAEILLPPDLIAYLARLRTHKNEASKETNIILRVMPSPTASSVPWELLPIDDEGTVLLDIATVISAPPGLTRDVTQHPPNQWTERGGRKPLRVIDPLRNPNDFDEENWAVLREHSEQQWHKAEYHPDPKAFSQTRPTDSTPETIETFFHDPDDFHARDRRWLSEALPGRSRFLFLGHVSATEKDPTSTGMGLGCARKVYSHAKVEEGALVRPFTAADAAMGTIGFSVILGHPSFDGMKTADQKKANVKEFGVELLDATSFPAQAWDESSQQPIEVDGDKLWPMPSRVALIACQSGVDLSHPEPYGLVTAFLGSGAELVTATRWTLITQKGLELNQEDGDPLNDAALAIDRIHETDDPLTALTTWQRERLAAWRKDPSVYNSPVTWAAFTNFDGRLRQVPNPPAFQEFLDSHAEEPSALDHPADDDTMDH